MGRPRKNESAGTQDSEPRDQILAAAGDLFAEHGIGEVSMLQIAERSGLVQSSLYYWFRRKELIVAELLQQVNRLPLAYAKKLKAEGGGADVQLYRLVRFDVKSVCEFPLEITEVHRLSRRERGPFDIYWRERRELVRTVERLVLQGIEEGCFRKVDAFLCALTIIAQNESVQNWHQRGPRSRPRAGNTQEDPAAQRYRHAEIADFVATQTLASLLANPTQVDAVRARAEQKEPR